MWTCIRYLCRHSQTFNPQSNNNVIHKRHNMFTDKNIQRIKKRLHICYLLRPVSWICAWHNDISRLSLQQHSNPKHTPEHTQEWLRAKHWIILKWPYMNWNEPFSLRSLLWRNIPIYCQGTCSIPKSLLTIVHSLDLSKTNIIVATFPEYVCCVMYRETTS